MKNNETGFGLGIVLVISAVLIVVGLGLYIFNHSKSNTLVKSTTINSYDSCVQAGNPVLKSAPLQCNANGTTYSNPNEKLSAPAEPSKQKYLIIKEWGIRLPLNAADNDEDLVYTYRKNTENEAAFFTFQRLIDYGICKSDIGVALSRSITKTNPPYSIDNPEQLAKAGDYYYSASYGGSYCYDSDNPQETAFYKSTGIASATVTNALKKLELVPVQ